MTTIVSGHSDDVIELDGDLHDEVELGRDGTRLLFSDGTVCGVAYGSDPERHGVWVITVVKEGTLFDRLERCEEDDGTNYTDKLYLRDGVDWCDVVTQRISKTRGR